MKNILNTLKATVNFLLVLVKSIHCGNTKKSAKSAKERLQIVVSHQRVNDTSPEFIAELRKELLAVICKYTTIDVEHINVNLQKVGNCSILELNVTIPELLDTQSAPSKIPPYKIEPTIKDNKTRTRKKDAVTCLD